MTDPYRPSEVRLVRSRETPPLWESFVTWGVAVVSILFGLLWWWMLASDVLDMVRYEVWPRNFRLRRYWVAGAAFTSMVWAGVALLMSRAIVLALYPCIALAMLLGASQTRMPVPLLAIGAVALAFTAWAYILKRRGRFRRAFDGRHARQDRAPE